MDATTIARRNVGAFIAFRVFFNARFYYPVFAILFLDMGLSLDQFALLNVAWAVAIVLLEVPSGALSDTIGRKRLVVAAAVLMVVEMTILVFVPLGNPVLLFALLLLNRVLSGAAEAAASGADEALTYDALARAGRADEWGTVLERTMRWQSLAFFVVLLVGAAVYDPALIARVAGWFGVELHLEQSTTLRFPLILTWAFSFLALGAALAMHGLQPRGDGVDLEECRSKLGDAMRTTLQTGRWIWGHGFTLVVIAAGMFADSIVRMFVTLASEYYRLIQIPEAAFGVIGAGLALLGLATPTLARWMAERLRPFANFTALGGLMLVGFLGVTQARTAWGLIWVTPLFIAMSLTGFFLSYYLNREASEERRATVLSFKGLAINLGYGAVGLLYAGWNTRVAARIDVANDPGQAFAAGLWAFPAYAFAGWMLVALWASWHLRRR